MKKVFRCAILLASPCAFASDINVLQQLSDGGLAIIAIIGLSILAVTVVIERLWHMRAGNISTPGLAEQALQLWQASRFDDIKALTDSDASVLARVIDYLVTYRHQDVTVLSAGAGDIASIELRQHQQKCYPLSVVATVAPIVGLLGTVVGMIESFHVIAFSGGMGDPALLAGGISKALINTAAGLTVALPALGLHHFFKGRLAAHSLALERQVNALINAWFMHPDHALRNTALQVVHHAG